MNTTSLLVIEGVGQRNSKHRVESVIVALVGVDDVILIETSQHTIDGFLSPCVRTQLKLLDDQTLVRWPLLWLIRT